MSVWFLVIWVMVVLRTWKEGSWFSLGFLNTFYLSHTSPWSFFGYRRTGGERQVVNHLSGLSHSRYSWGFLTIYLVTYNLTMSSHEACVKKRCHSHHLSQQVNILWDITPPHHCLSYWGHLRLLVSESWDSWEGISGFNCWWLTAGAVNHDLTSTMVIHSGHR